MISLSFLFFLTLLSPTSSAEPDWELAWAEEFNYVGVPDPNIWGYDVGFVRNKEEQYYMKADPRNSRVENGCLVIEAHHDPNHTIDGIQYNYSSAGMSTLGNLQFLYGRIESSLRVPPGKGIWPALWMIGTKEKYPYNGEIDIMEYVGHTKKTLWSTFHMGGYNYPPNRKSVSGTIDLDNCTDVFHQFILDWSSQAISVTVNGNEIVKYEKPSNFTYKDWPFDWPYYLLVNLALGGGWGGEIDQSIFEGDVKYYVDYIRYFIDKNDPNKELSWKTLNESLKRPRNNEL